MISLNSKRKINKRIGSLVSVLILATVSVPVQAQSVPSSTEEKRATPRDPAYRPAMIPPYLRKRVQQESPAQRFFRNPEGLAGDDLTRAVELPRPQGMHPIEEGRLEAEFHRQQDRLYLERTYLPQFGWRLDPDSHNPFYGEPEFTETRFDRGRNIFLLSSPFTFGLSYALMVGYRRSQGLPAALDGPQTAAVIGLGTMLSGLIVWHDYRRVWKSDTANLDRFARQLQAGRGLTE